MDKERVKSAAIGRWRDVARAIGISDKYLGDKHGPCPKCGGTDRWRVYDDFDQTGGCICNQCGPNLGDGFELVEWFIGCDFPAALTRVADCLGVQSNGNGHAKNGKQKPKTLPRHSEHCARDRIDEWCGRKPGVTVNAVGAAGGFVTTYFDYNAIAFDACDSDGKTGTVLYRATGDDWPATDKLHVRKTHCIGEDGVVVLGGRERFNTSHTVVKCEGVTDALAIHPLLPAGYVAVANICGAKSGKGASILADMLRDTGKHLVVIHDADKPGQDGAETVVAKTVGSAASIRCPVLPYAIEKDHGKDLRDYVNDGHTWLDIVKLIEDAKPVDHAAFARTKPSATRTHQDNAQPTLLTAEGRTEAANAKRLVARHGDVLRWCDPWNKWMVWDGKRWKIDDCRRVDGLAKSVVNDLWQEAAMLAQTAADATVKAMLKFVYASNHANGIRNMVALARCDVAILPSELDMHPWLLNVQNGTLDLRTGQLRPHEKNDYLTQVCPAAYDPNAKFSVWRKFLHDILGGDPQLVNYVQRLVGYSLTGSTRDHILPFLYGVGANGKSTFVSTIMAMLGPDYAMKAPTDLLLTKHDTHPTERADLYGKRFVACVEAEDGRRLAESLVKELTGGDRVRARRMREDFWEFTATHKILLAANHKPTVRGTDHGIWRRIKLLPFTVVIPDDQQDKELPAKLLDELPGILAWAVEGCRQWQQDGLQEPDCVRAATGDYRDEMDIVGRFLAECCILDPASTEPAGDLYTRYKEWCEETGERCVNQTRFGSQLTERGLTGEKTGGRRVRHGIRLAEGWPQPAGQ